MGFVLMKFFLLGFVWWEWSLPI